MSDNSSNSPRAVSTLDAKSIKVPSVGTSPEAQEQSPDVHHPVDPSGIQLLHAMWRSPDRSHQISVHDRKIKIFKNLPANNVAVAVRKVLKLSSEGTEVYFACAEYLTLDNREAANASGAYGFWMDIDCGDDKAAAGKGYATVKDAEEALRKFCQDAELPQPTHRVHSGGGLHVYWVIDSVISREMWQSSARQLKDLTKVCGFLADDSRTADIASVLRVPGTLNHKYSPPRSVSLEYASDGFIERSVMLDAITGAHNRLCSTVATEPSGQPTNFSTISNADVYGPPDLVKLKSALATLEPDCDEATWKLKRIAALATVARNHPELGAELYELGRSWSSGELGGKGSIAWTTPGGDGLTGEKAFDAVWQRFLDGKYTGTPATLGTIYHDAKQVGWVDPTTSVISAPVTSQHNNYGESTSLPFPEVESSPTPVNPEFLLNEISAAIRLFIVMDSEQVVAATLWVAFTWLTDAVEIAPLAIINAPEKACGKSLLLDVMGRMSARPLPVSNATTAALFRSVELWSPTLLMDEVDTFIRDNKEIKGIINAGHTRANAFVLRTVGDQHEPKKFKVWGAKAMAGISLEKHLPDSTMSRAIVFNLRRKLPDETVARLRHAQAGLFEGITSKLARFSDDHSHQVRQARPALPDELSDRPKTTGNLFWPLPNVPDLLGCGEQRRQHRSFPVQMEIGQVPAMSCLRTSGMFSSASRSIE